MVHLAQLNPRWESHTDDSHTHCHFLFRTQSQNAFLILWLAVYRRPNRNDQIRCIARVGVFHSRFVWGICMGVARVRGKRILCD